MWDLPRDCQRQITGGLIQFWWRVLYKELAGAQMTFEYALSE